MVCKVQMDAIDAHLRVYTYFIRYLRGNLINRYFIINTI